MNVDLKPCPFCGGDAIACNMTLEGAVYFNVCRASLVRQHQYVHDTGHAEAIAAWNTRATPDPLSDPRVKALVEAAKDARILLAEHEPHPLPVLGRLLAALRAIEEGGE